MRSRALVSRLVDLAECVSTNDELLGRVSGSTALQDWPDLATVVTTNQTGGRGRLGRVWIAPPGQALAVSVLLRPVCADGRPLALEQYGWLPLLAGVAMTRAVARLLQELTGSAGATGRVGLKWPNDVQIDGLKVSGLLAELLPAGNGVVQGAGLNLSIPREGLPTPSSTSLTLHAARLIVTDAARADSAVNGPAENDPAVNGPAENDPAVNGLADRALAAYLGELKAGYDAFLLHQGDPEASGILAGLGECCSTIGRRVRVELPGGEHLIGSATGIDRHGRLCVRKPDGAVQAVAAGDVTHLRYE